MKSGIKLFLLALLVTAGFSSGCAIFAGLNPAFQKLPMKGNGVYTSTNGGQLTVNGAMRILKLTGDNYQMGYDYGYLLGNEIINTLQLYVYWVLLLKYPVQTYNDVYTFQARFHWDAAYSNEMQGMLDGIYASVPAENLTIYPPNGPTHQLELRDLMVINTIGDWTCSSFAAWGSATADGELIMARNFDYLVDSSSECKNFHLVTVYKPTTGANNWVGVGVCGVIGTMTGMNEYGICGVLHNTDGYPSSDTGGYISRLIVLRQIMETMNSASGPADVEALLASSPAYYGNNIMVCFSNYTSQDLRAVVFEYDGLNGLGGVTNGRVTVRYASDNPALPDNTYFTQSWSQTNVLINVNHYLVRRTTAPGYTDDSGNRYVMIKSQAIAALSGGISVAEARTILMYVDDVFTLHSVIFQPEKALLDIYLSDQPKPAFECTKYSFTLTNLFTW